MSEKIFVASKEVLKKGVSEKDGRKFDWTLYKIKDSKGRIGSTFDDLPLDTEVEVEISEVEKDGKKYLNFKQSRPNIWAVVRDLQNRVELLEKPRNMPRADEMPDEKPIPTSEEDLFPPDLPF